MLTREHKMPTFQSLSIFHFVFFSLSRSLRRLRQPFAGMCESHCTIVRRQAFCQKIYYKIFLEHMSRKRL